MCPWLVKELLQVRDWLHVLKHGPIVVNVALLPTSVTVHRESNGVEQSCIHFDQLPPRVRSEIYQYLNQMQCMREICE